MPCWRGPETIIATISWTRCCFGSLGLSWRSSEPCWNYILRLLTELVSGLTVAYFTISFIWLVIFEKIYSVCICLIWLSNIYFCCLMNIIYFSLFNEHYLPLFEFVSLNYLKYIVLCVCMFVECWINGRINWEASFIIRLFSLWTGAEG